MKLITTLLGIVITASMPAHATDTTRASVKAEAVEAARSHQIGEGNPVPPPKAKVTKSERETARGERKVEGVAAARNHKVGEGDPVPAKASKVSREQRASDRAARKAESRRANKAGEITARGEKSY